MTNPCPSRKCDFEMGTPHPSTRLSSAAWMTPALGSAGLGKGDFSQTNRENDLSSSTDFLEHSSGSGFAADESSTAQAPCLEPDISQVKDIREVSEGFVASGLQI